MALICSRILVWMTTLDATCRWPLIQLHYFFIRITLSSFFLLGLQLVYSLEFLKDLFYFSNILVWFPVVAGEIIFQCRSFVGCKKASKEFGAWIGSL